jgi:hypothetical protein
MRYDASRIIMRRPSRAIAGLCIAVVALAALLPGIAALESAIFEFSWVLLPDETPLGPCTTPRSGVAQPQSLRSLLPSRAPPSGPLA